MSSKYGIPKEDQERRYFNLFVHKCKQTNQIYIIFTNIEVESILVNDSITIFPAIMLIIVFFWEMNVYLIFNYSGYIKDIVFFWIVTL